jgi:hypothetical protein
VRGQALGRGERANGVGEGRQPGAIDPLDLAVVTERFHRERPARPGKTAGRQNVVCTRCVVTGGFRCPRPDEQGAGTVEPGHGGLDVLDIDRQVLRGVCIRELDRGVEVGGEDDPAVLAQGSLEDGPPLEGGQETGDLGLDGIGEICVGRHQDRRGVGAVLRLGDEVGRDEDRVGRPIGQDHPLGRTGRQVDADEPVDLDLGGGHPGIAGADDPIDGRKTLVREPEGERTDRLGAAGDQQRVYVEDPRGAEQDRVDPSVCVRRGGDHDLADAGNAGGDNRHDERRRVRRGPAGDVAADPLERRPAPLDLDAGNDRCPGGLGTLRFGEPADVCDGLVEGSADVLGEPLRCGGKFSAIDEEVAVRATAAIRRVGASDCGSAADANLLDDDSGVIADAGVRYGATADEGGERRGRGGVGGREIEARQFQVRAGLSGGCIDP